MQEGAPKVHFTEDGGEFTQIGSNLAMIYAEIAPRSPPVRRLSWANLQQRVDRASPAQIVKNAPKRVRAGENRAGIIADSAVSASFTL
ncbi:hypothetical protein ACFPN2_10475 [Steroidobacter flavus]|uniref:Uncharacterized protein n=1 Tax=Steroidobacter flavus TaxID=1842136 RepID=A0ABV8SSE5_9GAMM